MRSGPARGSGSPRSANWGRRFQSHESLICSGAWIFLGVTRGSFHSPWILGALARCNVLTVGQPVQECCNLEWFLPLTAEGRRDSNATLREVSI